MSVWKFNKTSFLMFFMHYGYQSMEGKLGKSVKILSWKKTIIKYEKREAFGKSSARMKPSLNVGIFCFLIQRRHVMNGDYESLAVTASTTSANGLVAIRAAARKYGAFDSVCPLHAWLLSSKNCRSSRPSAIAFSKSCTPSHVVQQNVAKCSQFQVVAS